MTFPPSPTADGQLTAFGPTGSGLSAPRVLYVNGIQTTGAGHARTAAFLSLLLERPVFGVYNATAAVGLLGGIADVVQCAKDYLQNVTARPASSGNKPRRVAEADIPRFMADLRKNYRVWNEATVRLFCQLVEYRHQRRLVVAHSQGNLITSNALFILEDVLGSAALSGVRVYSLASPSPAWPVGLRVSAGGGGRQDNAYMNDFVAVLSGKVQDERSKSGDFRTLKGFNLGSLAPHDVTTIISTLNFLKSIRGDLGLPKEVPDEKVKAAADRATAAYPVEKK